MSLGLVIALLLARDTVTGPARPELTSPTVSDRKTEGFRLEPNRDGLIYRGQKFTAYIAADGTVRFDKKGNAGLAALLGHPNPPGTRTLQGSIEKWMGIKRPTAPPGDLPPPPNDARYTPPNYASPRELCQDPRSNCFLDQRKVYLQFKVQTDWENYLIGFKPQDPSREEKARLLAATAPLRDLMAGQAKAQQLKTVLPELPALLSALWSEKHPAAERRATLYELWKEFAEMPGNEPACATIYGFIRKTLPEGSPDAFTKKELDTFRKAGGPTFAPYGP